MYEVSIGEYVRTKSPTAKNRYRCNKRTRHMSESAYTIAERAIDVLREAGKGMRFSGMEEFGQAHAFWNNGHVCPEDGGSSDECEKLELESCCEWIEKRAGELAKGESTDLHLNLSGGKAFTEVVITRK